MTPEIRQVTVEFLRRGPRHNQLLSPLTDYLAICGQFPAGVVHVPYEHADIQNLLEDLRYDVASADTSSRLATARDRTGTDLALMLGSIPGLPGALSVDRANVDVVTHLRIVLSAAELALLPFEMSKLPVNSTSGGDQWLALQADNPVCITRHVRSEHGVSKGWPMKPKILFISGHDVPFEEHLDVFVRVLDKWQPDGFEPSESKPRQWRSEYLTVLEDATLEEIQLAAADDEYTHVHILAHGAEIEDRGSDRYGIALGGRVVRGAELALALSSMSHKNSRIPTVVTLASCDSAGQGSVMTPGGSVAHDLHAAGIPFVVASQFPISVEASVPFAEVFYRGQLIGEHPFVTICEVRRQLATSFTDEHAWASIVVYEALPADFDVQLEEFRYWQTRRTHERALVQLERLATSDTERSVCLQMLGRPFADSYSSPTDEEYGTLVSTVADARTEMPSTGGYSVESDGLRAAGFKRMAEVAYWLALAPDITAERQHELFNRCFRDLQTSLEVYTSTMRVMLTNVQPHAHFKATFHWIVGQVLLMQAILGIEPDEDLRGVARLTAALDLEHSQPSVRAWANVSLTELALLQLATTPTESWRSVSAEALKCAREVVAAMGPASEHVQATRRQIRRYLTWWGDDQFVEALKGFGVDRKGRWDGDDGVLATARAIVDVFTPRASASVEHAAGAVFTAPLVPHTRFTAPKAALLKAEPQGATTGVLEIEMMPANNGDCLWITYGNDADKPSQLLIDCGSVAIAARASERVLDAAAVELFVLTHIDADHISGAVPLFGNAAAAQRFNDVWFNGWNQLRGFLSVAQGEAFSDLLDREDRSFLWNRTDRQHDPPPPIFTDGDMHPEMTLAGGMKLTVLSPTAEGLRRLARDWRTALRDLNPGKLMLARRARPSPIAAPEALDLAALAASGPTKDSSVPNLSSIAMLAEFGGRAVLFTGDAHADVLASSIRLLQTNRGREGERLRLDALKLSHHGSANATTPELLGLIDCSNYLVSTDGSIFYHPDRSAIARVIVHGGARPTLHFNYRTDLNDFWGNAALQQRYDYATHYGDAETGGLSISL
jgi:hypothetical protein